jgi:uncharacterized membrane protein
MMSTVTQASPQGSAGLPGLLMDRVYIFMGVFVVLVLVAVGITLYSKRFHARREAQRNMTAGQSSMYQHKSCNPQP